MKKRRTSPAIFLSAIFFVLLLLLWLKPVLHTSPDNSEAHRPVPSPIEQHVPSLSTPVRSAEGRDMFSDNDPRVRSFFAAYAVPIAFYGKVVDETGGPVSGAQIRLVSTDSPTGDGSKYDLVSDRDGDFELHGARGLNLAVWASKVGYYTVAASRGRNYVYGGSQGKDAPPKPTPENPAIFVLQKMGEPAQLVHIPLKTIKVPKDGAPVEVDLTNGKAVALGHGHLRINVWTKNEGLDPNRAQPYEWKAQVTVPDGGIVERVGDNDFVAPEDGYDPAFEVGMDASTRRWRKGFEKQFFAKLKNGQYARFQLELTTAGDHFFALEVFLNPEPGNRNLEFDTTKAIRPD